MSNEATYWIGDEEGSPASGAMFATLVEAHDWIVATHGEEAVNSSHIIMEGGEGLADLFGGEVCRAHEDPGNVVPELERALSDAVDMIEQSPRAQAELMAKGLDWEDVRENAWAALDWGLDSANTERMALNMLCASMREIAPAGREFSERGGRLGFWAAESSDADAEPEEDLCLADEVCAALALADRVGARDAGPELLEAMRRLLFNLRDDEHAVPLEPDPKTGEDEDAHNARRMETLERLRATVLDTVAASEEWIWKRSR